MFIMCHAVSGSLIVAANRHRHGRRVVIRLASLGENRILLHEMVLIDIRVRDYSLYQVLAQEKISWLQVIRNMSVFHL